MKTPENPSSVESLELSKVDTSQLIAHLNEYNDQFNWGRVLARQMMASWGGEENDGEAPSQTEADQILGFENMKITAEPLLNATGLELQPVKSGVVLMSSEGTQGLTEMKLNLKSGEQFVKYLQALTPEDITPSQAEGLKEVAKVLISQFQSYDLEDPNNEPLLELMGNATKIIEEYKRLGENESIAPLEVYLNVAKQGILREYRAAEDLELNKPFSPGKFTLEWHKDASPDFLQGKWNKVIDTLHALSQNPKAEGLYKISRATAEQAIENGIRQLSEWIEKEEKEGEGDKYGRKLLLSVLTSTKNRLSEF